VISEPLFSRYSYHGSYQLSVSPVRGVLPTARVRTSCCCYKNAWYHLTNRVRVQRLRFYLPTASLGSIIMIMLAACNMKLLNRGYWVLDTTILKGKKL